MTEARKPRILTGDRPTGPLHLGHYVGSLQKRVQMQHEYETFLIIADLHMLTTKNSKEDIADAFENARSLVVDSIGAGVDPTVATFYLQSGVPEVCEINTIFQDLTTVPRLERIPSLKDMARDARKEEMPYGLLGYPVLQAADILAVRANCVPVGKDNAAHVEVTREIARRFNNLYGEVFPIPELVVGDVPSLAGIDGTAKMSKSLKNAIYLSDDPATLRKKVFSMYTDPNRVRADIPGKVEGNPVFQYLDAFATDEKAVAELKKRYRAGQVADVEVKQYLYEVLDRFLEPIRARREEVLSRRGYVESLIVEGTERVRAETQATVREMRAAMGLASNWNRLRRRAEQRAPAEQAEASGSQL